MEHRSWYVSVSLWSSEDPIGSAGMKTKIANAEEEEDNDVYVVPFDEHFTRCPVSKELFETFWDDEEGGLMFRNAVKILVTEAADASLFEVGRATEVANIRYCIVHKLLVLDGWVLSGKALALSKVSDEMKDAYVEAAGDDDDEDVFVAIK